jgi:hypothetical protein
MARVSSRCASHGEDHARQEPAGGGLGDYAAAGDHEPEPGRLGGDPHVGRECHGRADADRGPVDGDDHWLARRSDPQAHYAARVARQSADPLEVRAFRVVSLWSGLSCGFVARGTLLLFSC